MQPVGAARRDHDYCLEAAVEHSDGRLVCMAPLHGAAVQKLRQPIRRFTTDRFLITWAGAFGS